MLLLLAQMVFCRKIHVFPQLTWTGLSGANRFYVHFETPSLQKYSFENVNRFSQGNNMLGVAASNIVYLFSEISVFLQQGWIGLFGGKILYIHLESPKLQKVFLWKVIEFSQGNNVLAAASSKIDGYLESFMCFLNLTKPLWRKQTLPPFSNT
jgi:hypothetical protein